MANNVAGARQTGQKIQNFEASLYEKWKNFKASKTGKKIRSFLIFIYKTLLYSGLIYGYFFILIPAFKWLETSWYMETRYTNYNLAWAVPWLVSFLTSVLLVRSPKLVNTAIELRINWMMRFILPQFFVASVFYLGNSETAIFDPFLISLSAVFVAATTTIAIGYRWYNDTENGWDALGVMSLLGVCSVPMLYVIGNSYGIGWAVFPACLLGLLFVFPYKREVQSRHIIQDIDKNGKKGDTYQDRPTSKILLIVQYLLFYGFISFLYNYSSEYPLTFMSTIVFWIILWGLGRFLPYPKGEDRKEKWLVNLWHFLPMLTVLFFLDKETTWYQYMYPLGFMITISVVIKKKGNFLIEKLKGLKFD